MDQIFAKEEKAKDEAAELFKPVQKKEPEEPDDYSEADGAAEDADDYIARMALNAMTYENQRKQGMAAVAEDEYEEEEKAFGKKACVYRYCALFCSGVVRLAHRKCEVMAQYLVQTAYEEFKVQYEESRAQCGHYVRLLSSTRITL